jgi:hypothetical protein
LGSFVAGPLLKGKTAIQVADKLKRDALHWFGLATAANLAQSQQDDQYKNHTPKWASDR